MVNTQKRKRSDSNSRLPPNVPRFTRQTAAPNKKLKKDVITPSEIISINEDLATLIVDDLDGHNHVLNQLNQYSEGHREDDIRRINRNDFAKEYFDKAHDALQEIAHLTLQRQQLVEKNSSVTVIESAQDSIKEMKDDLHSEFRTYNQLRSDNATIMDIILRYINGIGELGQIGYPSPNQAKRKSNAPDYSPYSRPSFFLNGIPSIDNFLGSLSSRFARRHKTGWHSMSYAFKRMDDYVNNAANNSRHQKAWEALKEKAETYKPYLSDSIKNNNDVNGEQLLLMFSNSNPFNLFPGSASVNTGINAQSHHLMDRLTELDLATTDQQKRDVANKIIASIKLPKGLGGNALPGPGVALPDNSKPDNYSEWINAHKKQIEENKLDTKLIKETVYNFIYSFEIDRMVNLNVVSGELSRRNSIGLISGEIDAQFANEDTRFEASDKMRRTIAGLYMDAYIANKSAASATAPVMNEEKAKDILDYFTHSIKWLDDPRAGIAGKNQG